MGNARRLVLLGLLSTVNACGGKTPQPTPGRGSGAGSAVTTTEAKPPEPPPAADRPPELFEPAIKKVGVGQTVSFSTAAIDQDLDETRVEVTRMPASAKFDPITQTVTWTPTKADIPGGEFTLQITQPGKKGSQTESWLIDVDPKKQPLPVAETQTAIIETVLMIRQPKRLEQINKDWPLDKMLLVSAENFKPQFDAEKAKALGALDKKVLFDGFLTGLAQTHQNPRLDPASPQFDKAVFGDPAAWKIVTLRPRIDRAWTELRVVYQAVKAPEPVFAMFRIRPVTEFVPALPRPAEEKATNNKVFLGLVAKHLLPGGAPSEKLLKDQAGHGKVVAAFMKEFMAYDDTKTAPYLKTFSIGIATEARMGGGSARNPDGTYKNGDGWGWSAMKPFITPDGKSQQYTNVIIPGFWTKTVPSEDKKSWIPTCGPRWTTGDKQLAPGHDVLCRKTLGFVDLPSIESFGSGDKVKGARIDANHLFVEHKNKFMVADLALDDGRRDVGEENGMTCSQCHIRNFGMHDYADLANTDPTQGVPKTRNKKIATLNFVIVPSTHWEEFTLDFLKHQECRAKQNYEQFLGADAAKGLTCPLAP
ncbi:MAG: hypothetical protein JWP01_3832 [Myxococcales bacterium]|nr:hypothetical protein [Myxococcales bacterium]